MILYDYVCTSCGPFVAWNSVEKSSEEVICPTCSASSSRIVMAPYLADMDPNNRIAHQRNEKSAHEPEVVKMISGKGIHKQGAAHSHAQGRKRHHHHGPSRPWMLGH